MDHEILRTRVEEACEKLAKYGIEGCDEREITLACFGLLMFNGVSSLEKSVSDLRKTFEKLMRTVLGGTISVLVAVVLALIFI